MSDTDKIQAQALADAIQKTGVAEVLKISQSADKVSLVCRVSDKKAWCTMVEYVLARKKKWSEHICQQYFMRNGRLVYGWNFILMSSDLADSVKDACKLIRASVGIAKQLAPVGSQLDSMPLVGVSRSRSENISFDPRAPGPDRGGPSHKGAYPIGGNK
jgi:hypothetical protein